ncbi:MAG: hypothetical protein OEV42_01735 [Deltaproteobacteria bacterium]|nr:hypothetical protein [Deltaproteobacteria bacterium]
MKNIKTLKLTIINKDDNNFDMKYLKSNKGELTLGGIVLILVLLAVAYIGVKMAIPLVRYQQVKEIFRKEVAHLKTASVPEVRRVTLIQLNDIRIKLYPDEDFEDGLRIYREEEEQPYIMEAAYEHVVSFPGGYKYKYVFYPRRVAKWK